MFIKQLLYSRSFQGLYILLLEETGGDKFQYRDLSDMKEVHATTNFRWRGGDEAPRGSSFRAK